LEVKGCLLVTTVLLLMPYCTKLFSLLRK